MINSQKYDEIVQGCENIVSVVRANLEVKDAKKE